MKKFFFTSILLFFVGILFAQCPERGISTSPDNPVNNERPAKENTFFDWRTPYYQVNSSSITGTQIESPFFQGYQNSNVFALYENKDMFPEDGWELINYNMGFNENGTLKNPPPDYVHLILYNKHTGVLRAFLSGDNNAPFNGARVLLTFANGQILPSTLSNASAIFALDKFETDPQIVGVTRYLNGNGKWFYADFQMSYDVCSCLFESAIVITIDLINSANIDITGSFIGEIATITNGTGTVPETGFSLKEIIAAGQKAQKSYKSVADFKNDQEKALHIEGKTDLELNFKELTKRHELNEFQEALKKHDFLLNGLKAAPYIAGAIELVNFFIGGGKSTGPEVVQLMPMSINGTIKLGGTLEASYPYKDVLFYTPGSKNTEIKDANLYPYYNEVLGVFNLLKTPEMKYTYSNGGPFFQMTFGWLEKEIEYVINPAAGFDAAQSEVYGNIIERDNAGVITAETGFFPISALKYIQIIGGYPFNAELKLMVNLKRTGSTEQTQNVLLVSTYPIKGTECYTCSSPFGQPILYAPQPINLVINTVINSTEYSTPAWNTITVAPGGTIKATNWLVIPQVIRDLQNYPKTLPQPNATAIETFCNGPLYAGNPSRGFSGARMASPKGEEHSEEDGGIYIYPNPNNGSFTVQVSTANPGRLSMRIVDSNGRTVDTYENENQQVGVLKMEYQNYQLKPGLYLCVVESSIGIITKKIFVK